MDAALAALRRHLERDRDAVSRQRGRSYARAHRVFDVRADGASISASVMGSYGSPYTTHLAYNKRTWHPDCSCPVGAYCKHAQALGLTWLDGIVNPPAHHQSAGPASTAGSRIPKKSKRSFRQQWEPVLAEKIGRPLTAEEARLLGQLSALFAELRQKGQISRTH